MIKPDAFLERFVLPLVAGGAVHVGAPLGHVGLLRLSEGPLDAGLVLAIGEARSAVASGLLLDPLPPRLDAAALRLAVALHDLLFLLHPAAGAPLVRDRRVAQLATHAAALARLPLTTDADDLVARHTMLHLFPTLGRADVRISFWAGRREFHGEAPPHRLYAWRDLRKVREERWRASCFVEAAAHPLGAAVVRALLDGSPLTDLLHPLRIEPRFVLGRAAAVLTSQETCRLVAYQLLDQGLEQVGATLAQATLAELDRPERARVRYVLAFLSHLHLCQLFGPRARERRNEVGRLAAGGDGNLRDFYGLYAAIRAAAPELGAPRDASRDRRLAAQITDYAAACEAACGPGRVVELGQLVVRALHASPLGGDGSPAAPPAPGEGASG